MDCGLVGGGVDCGLVGGGGCGVSRQKGSRFPCLVGKLSAARRGFSERK